MEKITNQEIINERKKVWQLIRFRMNERRITPKILAERTLYSQEHIERGIGGEAIPITTGFLCACIMSFNLTSGRTKYYEETVETLPYNELIALLAPPPVMPPRQGNFWDSE
jgi:hypothetical protein